MLFRCFKNCLWCSHRLYKMLTTQREMVPAGRLPWLWIGAEFDDGSTEDVSNIVNPQIQSGDFVDIKYLESRTGYVDVKWLILYPTTIKQRDFPVGGFVIV